MRESDGQSWIVKEPLCPRKSCQGKGESQMSAPLGLKGKWPASIWIVSKGFLDEGEMNLVGERGSEGNE